MGEYINACMYRGLLHIRLKKGRGAFGDRKENSVKMDDCSIR